MAILNHDAKRASKPIVLGSGVETIGRPIDTLPKSSFTSMSINLSVPDDESPRKRSKTSESGVITSTPGQGDIFDRLEAVLNGTVFHDPHYLDETSCDNGKLGHIIVSYHLFDPTSGKWTEHSATGHGDLFYGSLVRILNDIGQAAHSTTSDPTPFLNQSDRQLKSTFTGISTSPYIIKYESISVNDPHIHWHGVDFFAEVKLNNSKATEGFQQSARYTQALLARRINRIFVVSDTTAISLRYDHSVLVYSDDIDTYTDLKNFAQVVDGMLLASPSGYNSSFENEWSRCNGRPRTLHRRISVKGISYDIPDIWCNYQCVRGRATLVLTFRKITTNLDPEIDPNAVYEHDTIDATFKLLGQDPTRFQNRFILEQFIGVYGLCQLLSDPDNPIHDNSLVYSRCGLGPGPPGHVFDRLKSSANAQCDGAREVRLLLMQPGRPLSVARDSFELEAAFVSVIMCYWTLMNSHVQHRDISTHNILLPYFNFRDKNTEGVNYSNLDHNYGFKAPGWLAKFNDPLASKCNKAEEVRTFDSNRRYAMLERVIEQLGPEPRGFLLDFDLGNILSIRRDRGFNMHAHRTGTLPFMAVDLMLEDELMPHNHLHDLESFFWVLLYIIINHREGSKSLNKQARDRLNMLNTAEHDLLGYVKHGMLIRIARGKMDVKTFGTIWATELASTIQQFAAWIDFHSLPDTPADPDTCFEDVINIFLASMPDPRQDAVLNNVYTQK